jgi:Holliday junction resolvase RusA-like endonuclease
MAPPKLRFCACVNISPKTFGDKTDHIYREKVRDRITEAKGKWENAPIGDALVILDFYLKPERFRGNRGRPGNDLDNLAKLVLDALCIEVNGWKGYGILRDDTDILDLLLRKRESLDEGVNIRVYDWSERALMRIHNRMSILHLYDKLSTDQSKPNQELD